MPLNSVQLYVQSLLNGITIPSPGSEASSTLECYITPPTLEDLDGPRAYIWGGRQTVRRQTMPRTQPNDPSTAGFKYFTYTMDIYLSYLTNPNDTDLDQEFPLFVDAVLSVLWNTQIAIFIDPLGNPVAVGDQTNEDSQILAIGEQWDMDYPVVKSPATQRMLYYTCRIAMQVEESVKG